MEPYCFDLYQSKGKKQAEEGFHTKEMDKLITTVFLNGTKGTMHVEIDVCRMILFLILIF